VLRATADWGQWVIEEAVIIVHQLHQLLLLLVVLRLQLLLLLLLQRLRNKPC
jgi:hypothetical protein